MKIEPKFKIGDRVCEQCHEGNPWYVIGVVMRPCYDVIAWEYHLGRAIYSDHPMDYFGSRVDVATKGPLPEDQIVTEETWLVRQRVKLTAELTEAEHRVAEIQRRKNLANTSENS